MLDGHLYILNGHDAVIEPDIRTWSKWMQATNTHVAKDELNGYLVSTVFLGLDHNFTSGGKPQLFDTMVFPEGDMSELYCARYATWDEAEAGHKLAIQMVRSGEITEQGEQT
jgi:hypothetical protein